MIVLMESGHAALAALAEDVGQALIRYASRLRIPGADGLVAALQVAPPAAVAAPPGSSSLGAVATATRAERPEPADPELRRLGVSQKRVLEAVRAAGDAGTTAKQVAAATGLKSTNTPRMLKTLAERGLVSSWGSNPIVWYVEPRGFSAPR